MKDWILGLLVGIILGVVISFSHFEENAIKHNCAYYAPTTGEFTWKDCK